MYLLLLLFVGCASKNREIESPAPPNILIILVDDLGKEWISTYGAEDIETPNVDALAHSGLKFNNVYGMPQCTPSRVTLLTGQYPFRHGWVNHWDVPRWGGGAHFDEMMDPSLAVEMKKAGYTTCIAGKWQIDDFRVKPDALLKSGFDEFCVWTGYEAGNPPSAKRYHDPYIYTKGSSKTYKGNYGPDLFKDFIIDFIHSNQDNRMFIYYPMVLTHTPFEHTPIDSATNDIGKHKSMIKYMDMITGDITNSLEETGIRENTLIIWTTDNGTTGKITGTLNGRKIKGGKGKTSESGICLPFIVSWPGVIEPNQISNELVDFSDIFPTCLDLAGIEIGSEMNVNNNTHIIDGLSFKPVLLNQNEKLRRNWILGMGGGNNARLTENGIKNQYVFRDRVVRNKRYKLTVDPNRQPVGFYDLLNDPDEKINIVDSLRTGDRKKNFNDLYEVPGNFPSIDANPKYRPNPDQKWDIEITTDSKI